MKHKIATGILAALILAGTFFAGTLMPQARAESPHLNQVAEFSPSATACLDYSILYSWSSASIGSQEAFRDELKDVLKLYVQQGGGCSDFAAIVAEINSRYCPENECREY
jgi:hypothetical protein